MRRVLVKAFGLLAIAVAFVAIPSPAAKGAGYPVTVLPATFVDGGNPTTNYFGATNLRIKTSPSGSASTTRYPIFAGPVPSGGVMAGLNISYEITNYVTTSTVTPITFTAYAIPGSVNLQTVTWNTQPAIGAALGSVTVYVGGALGAPTGGNAAGARINITNYYQSLPVSNGTVYPKIELRASATNYVVVVQNYLNPFAASLGYESRPYITVGY